MKVKLELSIAMLELAGNKISKTHDHDIANSIIDSFRAGLRTVVFQNIAEKNELASALQTYQRPVTKVKYLTMKSLFLKLWVYSVVLRRKLSLPSKQPC